MTPLLATASHKTLRIKSFPRKKQKQEGPIPQWICMKTGNNIRYSSKRRYWKEPSWVYKELSMRCYTYLHCIKVAILLPSQAENVTTVWTVGCVFLGVCFFSLNLLGTCWLTGFCNKYVRPFISKKKNRPPSQGLGISPASCARPVI